MKRILIALCLIVSPAWAEQVTVRSGDHETFSRLVFDLPPDVRWEVTQGEDHVEIELDQKDIQLNIENIFYFIPRTRILDVQEEADRSSIRIEIASGTSANYFSLEDGSLVLDVGTGFEKADKHSKPSWKLGPNIPGGGPLAVFTPFYQRPPSSFSSKREKELEIEENMPTSVDANTKFQDAELNLRYQIARAAAQGLIETDLSISRSPATTNKKKLDANTETLTQLFPNEDQIFPMEAMTAIDRDNLRIVGASHLGARCLSDEDLAISTWLDETPIFDQISYARGQLLGEFDEPSTDAVEKLAKLYIASGFGAEARALLDSMPVSENMLTTLKSLAAIVDNDKLPLGADLAEMTDCNTNAAFWGLLASDAPLSEGAVNFAAAKRAFSALPSHLRTHLGPRTIDRFLSLGAIDVADSIRSSLKRVPGALDESVILVDYRFPESTKSDPKAADELITIINSNRESGHEALIYYIETRIKNREPIDDETIQSAAALAYENRGLSQEFHFLRANILGLGSTGRFGMAFSKLQAWPQEFDPMLRSETVHELFRLLSEVPDDDLFLNEYFPQSQLAISAELPEDLRLSLANRLIDLGFSSTLEDILSESIKRSERGRTLLARAAINEGQISEAISYVKEIDSPEGIRLLATAYSLGGNHNAAREAFERLGDYESSSREAWRSGNFDYSALKFPNQEPRRDEHLALGDKNVSEGMEPEYKSDTVTLERARNLLNLSKTDRDIFSSMLMKRGAIYDD
ncbi:hypothetical protein [Phaeovulum sp. NW3]|uniref:hypothetical protein n=1 Tax=Phaeovulum sp. NW3 TaxID=2934933 RepID=UPI0020207F63|nr:hypothetical protein [Phaeovulum sp. NW3]MCL7466476.1 hypothetical protein [Phaeovulum sp. NW3]